MTVDVVSFLCQNYFKGGLMGTSTSPLFSYYLLLLLLICSSKWGNASERREFVETHHHTLEISSLFPASVCGPSTKAPLRASTLKVVHRHGPCYQLNQAKAKVPTWTQILTQDESRVNSIQARLAFKSGTNRLRDKKTSLPAKSGASIGTGNYIVTVGLGTPKKDLSLVFDTGSAFTWTQCEPCAGFCYKQLQPTFDPSQSSTYSNITCNSPLCSQLRSATGNSPRCSSTTCLYGIQYGDQSFSIGYFGKETLTLSADVFPSFYFGCGQNNRGLFRGAAGLIGLGQDKLSIVWQTAQKYGKYFSYCLPTPSSSAGYLSFGKNGVSGSLKFTPFADSQATSFYFISITAISVGGRTLPISSSVFSTAGAIIDSGTVITRLPPGAYDPLKTAFKQLMSKYPSAPGASLLDTCYDFSNYTTVSFPKIGFYFSGNVFVDIAPNGILYALRQSQVCLAFAGNSGASDVAIFGNTQQQTLQVAYDVAGGQLGFAPGGC